MSRTWYRACVEVDLDAIRANLQRVRQVSPAPELMAVVKADAYGHGASEVSAALRASGVEWLGVALPSEALALRAAGDTGALLAWLWVPGDPDVAACLEAGVDIGISSLEALHEIAALARRSGRRARVHLKVDTGLSRNGVPASGWRQCAEESRRLVDDGAIDVVGVWSHLADGEVATSDSNAEQARVFEWALGEARDCGLDVRLRHLGNSGAAWTQQSWDYELVRSGIAIYGISPGPDLGSSRELGLRPAMTVKAQLANVKRVDAGARVSYGGTWTAPRDTVIGLVPLGYADGVPRAGGGVLDVTIGGRRCPVVGRVAMDQFVVDLGPSASEATGDEVILFGPGDHGESTADEWASALGTIGYEIVTRMSARVPRVYVGGS